METQIIYLIIAFSGGLLGTVVPYLLKVLQDKDVKFDVVYVYTLVLTIIVSIGALVPNVSEVNFNMAFIVFCAGIGLNSAIKGLKTVNDIRNNK